MPIDNTVFAERGHELGTLYHGIVFNSSLFAGSQSADYGNYLIVNYMYSIPDSIKKYFLPFADFEPVTSSIHGQC